MTDVCPCEVKCDGVGMVYGTNGDGAEVEEVCQCDCHAKSALQMMDEAVDEIAKKMKEIMKLKH